ncbi:alpha/beta fold hydrolase [Mycobacterium sp. C31M]
MKSTSRSAVSIARMRRQIGAIKRSGDRSAELRGVTAPTLVIHGDQDRMVHPSGGTATQQAIAGAPLHTIPGMGHDLPEAAIGQIVDLIADHASADASATTGKQTAWGRQRNFLHQWN